MSVKVESFGFMPDGREAKLIINSHDEWFVLTYQKDKAFVNYKLMKLIKK